MIALPSSVGRRSTVRIPDSAPSTSLAGSATRPACSCLRVRKRGTLQASCAGKNIELAIDDEDARGRARQALHDLRDFRRSAGAASGVSGRRRGRRGGIGRRRLLGSLDHQRLARCRWRIEQSRPVVERGRDRLRGAGKRLLLGVAQKALQLANVLVAEPRDRQKHGQHQQQLRPYAQRDADFTHGQADS